MESVVLDGKEYIKAKLAAKDSGYTSDYLGQLCRAKKLDCRLVGRTWFVAVDSLDEHQSRKTERKQKKRRSPAPSQRASKDPEVTNVPIAVGSVQRKSTSRMLRVADSGSSRSHSAYTSDTAPLLPHTDVPTEIRVRSLKKESGSHFKPTPLPDVALHGKLKVKTLPDEIKELDVEKKEDLAQTISVTESVNEVETVEKTDRPHKELDKAGEENDTSVLLADLNTESDLDVEIEMAPEALSESHESQILVQQSKLKRIAPFAIGVTAVLIAAMIISAEQSITVVSSGSSSNLTFQLANIVEIFLR